MGGATTVAESVVAVATAEAVSEAASEVDLEALSDQEIDRLLGSRSDSDSTEAVGSAER